MCHKVFDEEEDRLIISRGELVRFTRNIYQATAVNSHRIRKAASLNAVQVIKQNGSCCYQEGTRGKGLFFFPASSKRFQSTSCSRTRAIIFK